MADADGAPIDRYVVLEHLSEGGMGAIYVGKKLGAAGFEMEVVLKQLLPEFTQQTEFIDLFLREAKLSATLDHANIIHTIDLVTTGGEYFIVMEYLAGADLRTLLKKAKRRGKRFSPAAAIFVCRELLSALAYAHVKRDMSDKPLGLIHRDVSPSNVLLSYGGEVKLTDFGIAKASTHRSLFYKVKGKIGYMSPEQARSEPIDHRADLYSLAVCLYEVLTGERLFVHAGLTTSADEIYSQPVPMVSRKVPGLPAELDGIMLKALALTPDARYQTAGELQEALMRCAHRNGLLMSAQELAAELVASCGPTSTWRDDPDEDDLDLNLGNGTEVYNSADDEDDEISGPSRVPTKAARPRTEIRREIGMTSLINLAETEKLGAKPLTEADLRPVSGPQRVLTLPGMPPPLPVEPVAVFSPPVPPVPPLVIAAQATTPRVPTPMPRAPTPMPQVQVQARLSMQLAQQAIASLDEEEAAQVAPRGFIRPWMVILLILIIGGAAAAVVGMSGPHLPPANGVTDAGAP